VRWNCWRAKGRVPGALCLFSDKVVTMRQDAFHYTPSTGTLADDIRRAQATSRAVERDPFSHIPATLRGGRGFAFAKDWLGGYGKDAVSP
jgi:hypothetical protein